MKLAYKFKICIVVSVECYIVILVFRLQFRVLQTWARESSLGLFYKNAKEIEIDKV